VGEETRIGGACSVTEGAVIGRGCRLTAGIRVGDGLRVEPDQVLSGAQTASRIPASDFPRSRAIRLQPMAELLAPASN
jgi:carbonic anhydrase/acetyltransferase-like protein (isoleucine patch superfamily)